MPSSHLYVHVGQFVCPVKKIPNSAAPSVTVIFGVLASAAG